MKRIALILLLVSFAYPQNRVVKSFILKYRNTSNATILNGTNQRWTDTTLNNFDLDAKDFSIIAVVRGASNFRPITARYSKGIAVTSAGGGSARLIVEDGVNTFIATAGVITDGRWHLVVCSYTFNSSGVVYVDGVAGTPVSNTAITGSINNTSRPLEIGSQVSGAAYWSGAIWHVQWVSGRALTADDVVQINATWRTRGLPSRYPTGQIIAWYDWKSGGTDLSGSNNHLTKVNDPIIVKVK